MAFGLGGSSSKSKSSSESQSTSDRFGFNQSSTYLDPQQQANQAQLQGGYLGALNQWQQQPGGGMGDMLGQIGPGPDYARQLGTGASLGRPSAPQQGINDLRQFADGSNPFLQQQVDQFGQDINDQYGVMQQRLGGQAAAAGQRGSSRQGIAEANSLGEYLGQYQRGVTNMRSNAYNQQQAAAGQVAGLEAQNYGTQGQMYGAGQQAAASRYSTLANTLQAQEAQRLQGLQLGMEGLEQQQNMQFNPFQIGAGIVGAPSILSQSSGFDWGQSQSTSSSKSKGKAAGGEVSF